MNICSVRSIKSWNSYSMFISIRNKTERTPHLLIPGEWLPHEPKVFRFGESEHYIKDQQPVQDCRESIRVAVCKHCSQVYSL